MTMDEKVNPAPAGEEVKQQPDFVLRILVEWKDEDAAWVAHCLELDLVAVAPEKWKAVQSLAVVIQAQIMAGLERGWEEGIPFAAPKKYFDRFEEIAKSTRPASPPPSAPKEKRLLGRCEKCQQAIVFNGDCWQVVGKHGKEGMLCGNQYHSPQKLPSDQQTANIYNAIADSVLEMKDEELKQEVAPPSAPTLIDHDYDFKPKQEGESDGDFLLRALREHRATHQGWVDHYVSGCDCGQASDASIVSREYQEAAVRRYDTLISIATNLIGRANGTIRPVQPPRI